MQMRIFSSIKPTFHLCYNVPIALSSISRYAKNTRSTMKGACRMQAMVTNYVEHNIRSIQLHKGKLDL